MSDTKDARAVETSTGVAGPISWAETLHIGVKMAGALKTGHRLGTLHRDVNPANILAHRRVVMFSSMRLRRRRVWFERRGGDAGCAKGLGRVQYGNDRFLDPGHNGANDASISRQVSNGRGGTKECRASGATTDDGFPGHMFNWDVVLGIRAALTQLGVRTAMSRGNDNAFTTSRLAGERIASVFHRLGPHGGAGLWNLKTHIEIRVNLDTGIEPVRR